MDHKDLLCPVSKHAHHEGTPLGHGAIIGTQDELPDALTRPNSCQLMTLKGEMNRLGNDISIATLLKRQMPVISNASTSTQLSQQPHISPGR